MKSNFIRPNSRSSTFPEGSCFYHTPMESFFMKYRIEQRSLRDEVCFLPVLATHRYSENSWNSEFQMAPPVCKIREKNSNVMGSALNKTGSFQYFMVLSFISPKNFDLIGNDLFPLSIIYEATSYEC